MKNKLNFLLIFALFALLHTTAYSQNKVVKGTITDVSGLPIPGANVLVKGTKTGTTTDFDGKFSVNATQGQVLVFLQQVLKLRKLLLEQIQKSM